uniref:Sugar phosphate transporter domain-containing protein n=1 Tax=Aegilops tauschii TaxID=37682 RepID=M8CS01_AEGTA
MGLAGEKFQLGTVGALSLSVVSSVSIVICNKALMSALGFIFAILLSVTCWNEYAEEKGARVSLHSAKRYFEEEKSSGSSKHISKTKAATTLTSWHLLVTFCSLHVALCMKLFEHKPFDARTVMGFGVLNGISIGLLNLSLGFNSVGFYQMTKLAIIPCTVILETLFFRKKFSRYIQLSLSVLLFGVGVATVTDLQLNAMGSVLSLLAIVTTCIAQISLTSHQMTNTIQKKFKVSSTQLLYQSCPYQALTLFIVGPFLDGFLTNKNVFAFAYTPQVLFFIVLSCLISVSVNFSTFLVIGKTSPVTYQVLGHLKTCLVLAFGYVLLHDPFSWRNILGILIAVVGMGLYSYFCTREAPKPTEASPQVTQVKEGESDPLIADSLNAAENGAAAATDEPLKVPMWSSKYARA